MSKHNSSLDRKQFDLFKFEESPQIKERIAKAIDTPIYYLSNEKEREEKKRENEALEIARDLSRHLSIWD
jgi:hypothetical protein